MRTRAEMRGTDASLYIPQIAALAWGTSSKVDCAACHHVALLTPEALLRAGLSPAAKVLDLEGRLRVREEGGRMGQPPIALLRIAVRRGGASNVLPTICRPLVHVHLGLAH